MLTKHGKVGNGALPPRSGSLRDTTAALIIVVAATAISCTGSTTEQTHADEPRTIASGTETSLDASSSPSAPDTSTTTAIEGFVDADPQLAFTTSPGQAATQDLDHATVHGELFVVIDHDAEVKSATFYLNDPYIIGHPVTVDRASPFQLADGSAESLQSIDTTDLQDGYHMVTVLLSMANGSTVPLSATFEVANDGE